MPVPVDLTELFGESWCVAVCPGPAPEALRRVGVSRPVHNEQGLDDASLRPTEAGVLLLARDLPDGWAVLLTQVGTAPLADQERIVALAHGETACALRSDPNHVEAYTARAGAFAGLDVVTGRLWGDTTAKEALTRVRAEAETTATEPPGLSFAQQAAAVTTALTGVVLAASDLQDPWWSGTLPTTD